MEEPQVQMPSRLVELKKQLIPQNSEALTKAWEELLTALAEETALFKREGSNIIPQVDFSELNNLTKEDRVRIKQRGCVVIRNVVDDAEALQWKQDLVEFIKANPDVEGFPKEDKQFFQLYWTRSQVRARSHPNVLASGAWLNNLYHFNGNGNIEGVELSTPLAYADRFRIRKPGGNWNDFPPHIDGGSIERWEDPAFRSCFASILEGKWKEHDPYDVEKRLEAKTSLYGRPNQASVFRTFQGWLAMSETGPSEGTLKLFPNVILSNAYLILRPFFRLKENLVSDNLLGPENWEFNISSPEFPGISVDPEKGFRGPRLTPKSHPHMNLETSMISLPKVNPGDMVFWHCDGVHSVEVEHIGKGDSSVMYIPAVPLTPQNAAYIAVQKSSFLSGTTPPDFPITSGEGHCQGVGKVDDINNAIGRRAMGLPIEVA